MSLKLYIEGNSANFGLMVSPCVLPIIEQFSRKIFNICESSFLLCYFGGAARDTSSLLHSFMLLMSFFYSASRNPRLVCILEMWSCAATIELISFVSRGNL